MKIKKIIYIFGLNIALHNVVASEIDEKIERLEYLKRLTLEELSEVEIKLDDTFDVFDGLIKARKVKVASGVEQNISQAPAITTVITAQDIEAMGARDVDEILETVPGLHVSHSEIAYRPIYIMRGIYSKENPEILLMINGIAMKSLESGNRAEVWAGMPVQNIAQIEIIRGPGSALYGADAMAGVINIVTKQADDIKGTEVGLRAGSFRTIDAWLLNGYQNKDLKVATSLQVFDTDGQKSIIEEDGQSQVDRMMGTQASKAPNSLNLGKKGIDARVDATKENFRLQANYRTRRNVEVGVPTSLDPEGRARGDSYDIALNYKNQKLADNWDFNAQLNFNENHSSTRINLFPAGAFGGAYPNGMTIIGAGREQTLGAEGSLFFTGWKQHLLRMGAGYRYAKQFDVQYAANYGLDSQGNPIPAGSPIIDLTGTPYSLYPAESTRINEFAYLQDAWKFAEHWELTTGFRYDHYSDFNRSFNPRLSLVWQAEKNFTTKLLFGKAFRAPSFRELYLNSPNNQLGNKNLKPETIQMTELAFDWRLNQDVYMSLNLFSYLIKDKILFQPDEHKENESQEMSLANTSPPVLLAQNVGSWRGKGFEFETRWKINNRSSLLFNYSFVDVRENHIHYDNEEHQNIPLENIPRHHIYLRTDLLLKANWYLNTQWNWISSRARNDDDELDGRSSLKGYHTFDFTIRYKDVRDDRWNFAFGIKNLFNSDAREPSRSYITYDLPLEGRNWFIETRYRFK
jgi:outer membrane receptor for ferrienterochelin and colicin